MKVCMWGNVGEALKGDTSGGGELQMALIAKALARAGNEVVIFDFNIGEDFVTSDGIKVLKIADWDKGIRILREITHRFPKLYSNLISQDADIYYCRLRDFTHILAFWAARKTKAKFILAMASDLDTLGFRMRLKYYYIPNIAYNLGLWWFMSGILIEFIHPWLLRKSHLILAQHEGQRQILHRKRIKSIIFQNLIELTRIPDISNPNHDDFIYVGWLDKRKGFAEFFELVQRSPLHTFKVIGPPRDKIGFRYYNKLKSFTNVTLFGKLSHKDTIYQIANSKALISTSPMEGFPNIFLEAWASGVPVLSLNVDPGGIIKREGLGEVADGNLDLMLNAMASIKYNDEFAFKAKAYVREHHALNETKIKQISKLFSDLSINNEIKKK